jgi:hypothetical protein
MKKRQPLQQILATTIRQEKEMKGTEIGNEQVELFLFSDYMVLYLKDPNYSTEKFLDMINSFSKVVGYKSAYKNGAGKLDITM